jgi:transcriptional regulator with XRE-family HTH domain
MARKTPDPVDKYAGARLRMRRLQLGLSQDKLAGKLGLSFQQVQKYENGINRMGSSRLHEVADILQVPVTFFFDGAPGQGKASSKGPSPAFVTDYLATSDGLSLTKAFMRIKSAKLRRAIVHLVENIADEK